MDKDKLAETGGPCETPLVELLERVPLDAHMTYEHHSTHHQMIPVGRLCHQAAAELRAAENASEQIEAAYREAWHEGYATGDAGGSYSAVENDWLSSDARAAALRSHAQQP